MARATPKKKLSAKTPNNILNFFQKADGSARPARPEAVDVKPDIKGSVKSTTRRTEEKPTRRGSERDPVVISDDEETLASSNGAKRRRLASKSIAALHPTDSATSAQYLDITLSEEPSSAPPNETVASPVAGPSRLPFPARPSRSSSPTVLVASPPADVPSPSPRRSFISTPQPPSTFPGIPGFSPPPSWPQIINTAQALDDPGDATSDDNRALDVGVGQDGRADEDAALVSDTEEAVEALPSMEPPVDPGAMRDQGMEWDEGDDEGMGMEEDEEGRDDEASEIVETPPLKIKPKAMGKMTECLLCGKSLKGKVVQQHINSCLDSKGSSRRPNNPRPITSINHSFSPAPSSPSPPPTTPSKGPNAFSVLMSGHKEREQWEDAEIDLKRDGKRTFGRRKAPFYKVLTGMPVAVDAFRYGSIPKVAAYLLTHAHSDHYTNLSKSWNSGPIYCSQTTANLIMHMLGVEYQWVHGLPDNIPFEMPNTGGVTVTPLEANHCPGSSIFLFEGPQTVNAGDSGFKSPYVGSKRVFRYLHCGDFRACPKHVLHPAVARAKIDTCYLDTTYLNPKYCFPPQPQVIAACASLARKTAVGLSDTAPPLPDINSDVKPDIKPDSSCDIKPDPSALNEMAEERSKAMMQGWLVKREDDVKEELVEMKDVKPKGRTLIVMGTYSIGKERIVKAVARALGSKIYCDPRKKGILLCETDPELHAMLSSDPVESQVHLLPLGNIQLDRLQDYVQRLSPHFDRVLGFRPTGWTYTPPAGTDLLPDVNTVIRRDQARTFTDVSLKPMRGSNRQFMMYGVPYSEHSSFFELTCFALSVPGQELKMIATVNVGNEKSRAKMKKWFEKWAAEKAKRNEKNLPAIVEYRDETYW